MFSHGPRRSAGVALITAMLVLALATAAAVSMASRQQLDTRRTANLLQSDQAYQHALGVEGWAVGVLGQDASQGKVDALTDIWATGFPPIDVQGGEVAGAIGDLQGRFNLNNLVIDDAVSATDLERFQRLLRILEVDDAIAQAVVDWIDSDLEPQFPAGAEDDFYLRMEPPYRSANRPMASPSELRLVRDVTPDIYAKLAPFVTALPVYTPINVNTAPKEVLLSLADGIGKREIEGVMSARAHTPFTTVDLFLRHEALAGLSVSPSGLGVSSSYFQVRADARIDRMHTRLTSLLARSSDGRVRALQRTLGRHTDR